jgi:glycerate dehydrogenase
MAKTGTLSRGVFLDVSSVDVGDLDLAAFDRVMPSMTYHALTAAADVNQRVAQADVVITNKVLLDRQCLQQHAQLKLVCVAATGTNNVDLETAYQRGIAVCNVTAYATASVVQHVFALILALRTRLPDLHAALQAGEWSRSPHFSVLKFPVTELQGSTLGIVGYGELGQGVARIAEAFGMQVLVAARDEQDRRPGRVPLARMLPSVDVLSLHCPLTEQTRNLIGTEELALMKPTALLINTARGGIVDEQALLAALQTGEIAAAGIDVLSREPPPADHPLLQYAQPNLIVTPHVAWASRQSRQRLLDEIAANIEAFRNGESRNRVV